jgi:outer membrane autotransporter protein
LPLLIGGTAAATRDTLLSVNRIIQTRIEDKRGMASGDTFYGDRNVWLKPCGSWGDQDDRNGVSGYTTDTYGMVGGVDGKVSSVVQLGGAFAFAKVDIDGESTLASQSADVDIFEFIGYGSYSINDNTNLNFQAGFGHNSNEGSRQIAFASAVASSDFDGQAYHLSLGVDRTYALGKQLTFVPAVNTKYIRVDEDAYTETGAGLLNLSVNDRTVEALIFGADAKLVYTLTDKASVFGDLGVGYDTINDEASITSAFAGAPNTYFVTNGIDPSPWLVQGGIGAQYKIKDNLEIIGRYDADYRSDYLNQTASLKLSWLF